MDVGHSRLLKFFKEGRYRTEMAEAPVIKIEKVFENSPNIESNVPGTQEIREVHDKNTSQENDPENTSEVQITGAEFTLSPVITVTKKESSLTKGDLKLQKVTVTEDIAMDEENGGYRISRESHESSQSSSSIVSQASSSTVVTSRRTEKRVIEGEEGEKSQDEKKSKIPIMRLRQAAEKVKKERRDQKAREQARRSSIPKLKDAKKVKRDTSLKFEPKVEDEFEKIYEEIVDNKQKEIDDKILAIQIDDAEKVDSKFEELVHSYDEDEQEKHTVSRVSKIPALRRRDDDRPSRIGALIDSVKEKSTVTETKLKDGGFKVTASTIRTKRFSRGNSRDLSKEEQTVNVTETIDIKESEDNEVFIKVTSKKAPPKPERSINSIKRLNSTHKAEKIESTKYGGSEKVVKETIVKESVTEGAPVKTKIITRVTSREISHDGQNDDLSNKFDDIKNDDYGGTVIVEEFDDDNGGKRIVTTKNTYSHSRVGSGSPGVTETVTIEELEDGGSLTTTATTQVRYIEEISSPEINETVIRNVRRRISTESQNVEIVEENNTSNKEIVAIKETETGTSKKTTKETIVKENVKTGIPVKTERFTRGISREMGNIKSTESKETAKTSVTDSNKEFTKKMTTKENIKEALPVKTERIDYDIKREVSNESQNVVNQNVTSVKEINREVSQQISRESSLKESTIEVTSTQITDNSKKETVKPEEKKQEIKKETMVTEQIEKDGIRIGIPVFTKTTESFSKGKIQSVEMSRTIEWKPADEIRTKTYSRSVSDKVTKKELKDTSSIKYDAPVIISKISDISNNVNVETVTETERKSTQDPKPKDPVLEKQIKDTVKDIANKIKINKITEYQSQEQVTNVAKSTYSLSKSIDLTVDRDIKKSDETARPKGFIDSKVAKENGIKQISKEYSTETNKESIKTNTVAENKETEYSNSSVREKDIDTEEVTILKGNVSRLKSKIAKEIVVVSKKENDEDLPKKKSILSKIAVFERLEPKEAYPVIMRPRDKKTCKYVPKETNNEQEPKIIDEQLKEQSKLYSFGDTNKVEISSNYDEVIYVNEPVIVDALWKTEEGYGQNVSTINRVITEKTMTRETRESKINERMNWETANILPGVIDFTSNESEIETARTIPAQMQFQDNENQYEVASTLPGKIDFEPLQTAEEVVETDDNNKILTDDNLSEYEAKINKAKPGKINLNIWKNQVEANKTLADKIDVIKSENIKEISKTLSAKGKVHVKSQVPLNKDSSEYDLKKYRDQEVAKILPAKIDFGTQEIRVEDTTTLPRELDNKDDDSLNQIGMTFQDQVTLKAEYTNQAEINKTSQNKIDVTLDSKQIELLKILPDKKDYLKYERTESKIGEKTLEVNKPTPGKINLNLWKNQVEVNKIGVKKSEEVEIAKTVSSTANYKTYEKQIEISKTKHERNESNKYEKKYDAAKMLPAQIDLSAIENQTAADKNSSANQSYSSEDYEVEIIELSPGIKTDTEKEAIRTLPAKIDFQTTEYQIEEPISLPGKIEFETYESQVSQAAVGETLQSNIHFSTSENQIEVVSTLLGKLQSNTDDYKVEIAKPLPGKLDLKAWENKVEVNKMRVDKLDVVKGGNKEEIAKTLPGKIDFTIHDSKVEDAKTLPRRIDINTYENKLQITKTSQTQVISEAYQSMAELATSKLEYKTDQGKDDLNKESNKVGISRSDSQDSLSDPELVDDQPDIERTKFNKVIGGIKKKMYFITNKNSVQNSKNSEGETKDVYGDKVEELQSKTYSIDNISQNTMNRSTTVTNENSSSSKNIYEHRTESIENKIENNTKNISTKEYEPNRHSYTSQNNTTTSKYYEINSTEQRSSEYIFKNETNENVFNFDTSNVQNALTRSAYGADEFKINNEEMTRAKSLAELDLGDAVHGQVRKMVGRLKSVDFGRRQSVKTEKISVKEMPKKMSVLEKIALFEGKASSSKVETTTFRARTTQRTVTKDISEVEYRQKIEELTTANTKFGTLTEMLYLPLSNGVEMPVIALGTALTDTRLLPHVIGAAIDLGYRAFDTAYIYGNEKEIGEAIRAKIDDGTVKREDLFIMSKLWSTFHRQDLVEGACRASLNNMGLDYFDLYMIHNPMSFKEGPDPLPKIATVLQYSEHDYLDAWFGMETLVTKGLAKSIGVSNFNSQQIQRILDKGRLTPVVNQVECHPYLTQQRLHSYCAERNITLSCFGVLGSKGTPAEYKSAVPPVIDDALIQVMASGLNVTAAQLLIRYQIELGHNVVVKSSSAAHLWDNLQALTFSLDQTQVSALHALNKNKRMFTFKGMGDTHRNYPFLAGY